ncbi:MAG: riboflavin kinase [Lachnospiraceae bacterium]
MRRFFYYSTVKLPETYLYDFAGDIYGKDITVQLLAFRRPEMKFDGVDSLKAQMQKDIAAGQIFSDKGL